MVIVADKGDIVGSRPGVGVMMGPRQAERDTNVMMRSNPDRSFMQAILAVSIAFCQKNIILGD
jgi:hypothetical protein